MATLETVSFVHQRISVESGKVHRLPPRQMVLVEKLPQVIWSNNLPWREANLWALDRTKNSKASPKTIWSAMRHIHAYAKWLESEEIDWWHFPALEADRCLIKFRKALIDQRDNSLLAPSTAKQRMDAVIRFYRWLSASKLLSPDWPMWREKQVGVRLLDSFGFQRTLNVTTTDLTIPNRKADGFGLEDGLTPLTPADTNKILSFAAEHASVELSMMLMLGFSTGMRLGTITDLKVETIARAVPSPSFPGFYCLAVGPGAHPRVNTKYGVTGQIWITENDLEDIKTYIHSGRRMARLELADHSNKNLVFLTRYGQPYNSGVGETGRAVHVEIGRLRKKGIEFGINSFKGFRFHQSRCTYATELAKLALKYGNARVALELVKQALLHRDENTTLKYIRFIEKSEIMSLLSDEFTTKFLTLIPVKDSAPCKR